MDEKHGYLEYRLATPPPSYPMTSRVARRKGLLPVLAMAALFAWSCWGYLRLPTAPARTGVVPDGAPAAAVKDLVPLEAHIMSKCPDARVSKAVIGNVGRVLLRGRPSLTRM